MEKLISEFSSGLFFWQTIIFVTLIFLLRKFAWKPILDSINERDESIRDALSKAEIAKKEMEILKSDNEKIMKEAIMLWGRQRNVGPRRIGIRDIWVPESYPGKTHVGQNLHQFGKNSAPDANLLHESEKESNR